MVDAEWEQLLREAAQQRIKAKLRAEQRFWLIVAQLIEARVMRQVDVARTLGVTREAVRLGVRNWGRPR